MKAMILNGVSGFAQNPAPLVSTEAPEPAPGQGEILIRVAACGVCHTEIDEIEGRTPPPAFPVIPGHQVVGRAAALGPDIGRFRPGDRVGGGDEGRTSGKTSRDHRHDTRLEARR